ncbi:hypothetical protein PSACC_01875 [Paramicrosporidium saccamoebae]|uniref:SH3 domain-containing protein n=1 Tax=Paramicrosporidium saccamoebae TaxID=1246581 RepID=A0A2H9TKP1_9FUNG|nr:hypothetical protein PSACC_01875 [Paramicrosporidium saccamoebae]
MNRLGTFAFPREETFFGGKVDSDLNNILPSELASALLTLPIQTADLCTRHGTLVESLKQRLLWPLQQSLKEHTLVKKEHKQEMLRIVKAKVSQEELVAKLKERYYNRTKERALLIDDNVAGLSGRTLEKRAKEAEQEADAQYRSGVYKLNELHIQWQSRMTTSAQEFQKLEETRLELTKNILIEYSVISHCHMQEQAVAYETLRDRAVQCDRVIELQEFIRRYGTGNVVPTTPAYSNFATESIEASLRKLSMRATQSPRKLYSSDSDGLSAAGVSGGFLLGNSLRDSSGRSSSHFSDNSSVRRGSTASLSTNNSFSSKSSQTTRILYRVKTLYAYQAQESDEISFKEDQILNVLSTSEDPWCRWPLIGKITSNSVGCEHAHLASNRRCMSFYKRQLNSNRCYAENKLTDAEPGDAAPVQYGDLINMGRFVMTVGEDVRHLKLKERRRLLSCAGGVVGEDKKHAERIKKKTLVGSYEIIRDALGTVGKVFLLRLDLASMPVQSQTIIRQKHYYHNSLDQHAPLQHGLQVCVRRLTEPGPPQPVLDGNGVVCMDKPRLLDRTQLHGTIRVFFSFNQAATIGRASKDTSMMRENLRIVTEHALDYVPLGRTFEHGQIM